MANLLVSLLVLVAFLAGFEFGRLYQRILAYLRVIHRLVKLRPDEEKKAVDHTPGVVLPNRVAQSEPINLSDDSGGVLPMSPRAVAMEEARRNR